ncbi:AraC family transcriptional regulator [Paenibacillus sp. 32O-W]|uniref:helix-turn-helix domain-containing protein n=1 Tax=Paenibacillus sp. 32O-W TaxID=1695218 RepID=UPI00072290B6|nr:helix-turn-helix transcriptional regulator [Paenibacillus sp. 32O-W]ALS27221.1 AraC family transcriptional regulator [Paenibacillus sp. 32O-W]
MFKKELQVTFTKYLTEKRIKRACELLRNTDCPIGEVSERTGYRDLFYFAKLFKKKMGCTPSEYRYDARPG